MDFWKLIEEGRNYFDKEMFIEAEQCFMQAEELRPDGKILTDIINGTDNFTPPDTGDESSFDVQQYILNIKSIKDMKTAGTIADDIYEYIAVRLRINEF